MEPILRGMLEYQQRVHPQHRALFDELRHGQSPKFMFITCSDSRIDPALILRSKPGDIFIARNAGNIVAPADAHGGSEAATIEYAVCVLGVEDLIVCGHSQCGAVSALVNPESLEGLSCVQSWVAHAQGALDRAKIHAADQPDKSFLDHCIECNVILQLEHLRTYPFVAERLEDLRLRLHGMVYHFDKGRIDYYEAAQNRFIPLSEAAAAGVEGASGAVRVHAAPGGEA